MTAESLRDLAIAAARGGGAVLRRYYGAPGRVVTKPDGAGPVSEADLASEATIVAVLRWSRIPILAEESGGAGDESPRRWIVDPLDGTSNFIRHLPWFCVGIALAAGDDVELGVVYAPLTDELFVAERGLGATLNGVPVRVSPTDALHDACLFTACDAAVCGAPARIRRVAHVASRARELRSPNAALLDLAYVAAGRADGFWEQGLAPWDIAAGSLLVREAGGETSDFSGGPLRFARREIVATNGRIHDELVAALSAAPLGLCPRAGQQPPQVWQGGPDAGVKHGRSGRAGARRDHLQDGGARIADVPQRSGDPGTFRCPLPRPRRLVSAACRCHRRDPAAPVASPMARSSVLAWKRSSVMPTAGAPTSSR